MQTAEKLPERVGGFGVEHGDECDTMDNPPRGGDGVGTTEGTAMLRDVAERPPSEVEARVYEALVRRDHYVDPRAVRV
jgi:hypothetical protein